MIPERYLNGLNVFSAYRLDHYDKIFFLEADIFLYENIDFLFELNNDPSKIELTSFWAKFLNPPRDVTSMVVFGLTPSKEIYQTILEDLSSVKVTINTSEYFMDEYLIPKFYKDKVFRLPIKHNDDKYYFHSDGGLKYFTRCSFKPRAFAKMSMEDIKLFFAWWKRYKATYRRDVRVENCQEIY